MAEPFVPGREMTVAVMGDRPLAVTEIATHLAFYDYEAKYADGGSVHTLPAPIHPDAAAEAMRIAVAAHRALGCRGVVARRFPLRRHGGRARPAGAAGGEHPARHDPHLAGAGAGGARGIAFPDLCAWMVEQARHGP